MSRANLNTNANASSAQAAGGTSNIDELLKLISGNGPSIDELQQKAVQAELHRQMDIPYDGNPLTFCRQFDQYATVVTGACMDKDPFVRLSVILLWITMQTEKIEGKERSDTTVMFNDKDGYYFDNPDLMSMTSLELNPTRPRAPAPRATPLYRVPVPRYDDDDDDDDESSENGGFVSGIKARWARLLGIP